VRTLGTKGMPAKAKIPARAGCKQLQ
jgi:hypothetical protein